MPSIVMPLWNFMLTISCRSQFQAGGKTKNSKLAAVLRAKANQDIKTRSNQCLEGPFLKNMF